MEADMDEHYMSKLAAIKSQFDKGGKISQDFDMIATAEGDNSMSNV